jgi:hypothetical protein
MAANERLQPPYGAEIPVIVTLSARSGLYFAAPVHIYDGAGLSFYHRREGSASSFDHPGDFLGCCENHGRTVAHHAAHTTHHPADAFHASLLRCLLRGSEFSGLFEEGYEGVAKVDVFPQPLALRQWLTRLR